MKKHTNEINRRGFFSSIANSSLLATFAGFGILAVKFLTPNVLFEPSAKFTIGKPEDFPIDSVTFLSEKKLFIVNRDDEYSVISATCTHLGCTVNLTVDETFHCPCHGSQFDENGKVLLGPAQASLTHYEITFARNNTLVVDLKEEVEDDYTLIYEA